MSDLNLPTPLAQMGMPCGMGPEEASCPDKATKRVHDPEDRGRASAWTCDLHEGDAVRWVEALAGGHTISPVKPPSYPRSQT